MPVEQGAPAAAAVAAQLISTSRNVSRRSSSRKPQAVPVKGVAAQGATPATATAAAHPPTIDLLCHNGQRTIASVAVVLFHCFLIWRSLVPAWEMRALLTKRHWFAK